MNPKRLFLSVALLSLVLQVVDALLSIAFALPAQVAFGDRPTAPADATPALVAEEFLTKGTALAPPLALMIAFAVFLLLASRKRIVGVIGTVLLVALSVLFTAATIGEYANPDRFPGFPGGVYLALLIVNSLVIAGVIVLGIASLVRRRPAETAAAEPAPLAGVRL
ncbi:hypothetical protein [Naasia sp. SYSU D00057]|uniref:hypothetical protein n=1 Tax=Naasia sp. SYSU D00057 TaxID=2817380 RepID=UPI001B3006AE|nr:hypothetical protein [Naasia sp. SYSU D00057]